MSAGDTLLARWRAAPLRARAFAFLAAITVVLIGMAAREHAARRTGAEIVLRSQPVDPRDVLRGAYVDLDYEVERVRLADLAAPADPADWRAGDRLWLSLRREGALWAPVALSARKPAREAGLVAVRARYLRREDFAGDAAPGRNPPVDVVLDIGADHYYADEETAKELEALARRDPMDVVLAVDGGGRAVIKGLIVAGRRRDEAFF